jgi:hypothetical protein
LRLLRKCHVPLCVKNGPLSVEWEAAGLGNFLPAISGSPSGNEEEIILAAVV